MRIIIKGSLTDLQELLFIYLFLPKYMYKLFLKSVNKARLKGIDEQFNIDSYKALLTAFLNLYISKLGKDSYIIGFNKNLVVGNNKLGTLLLIISNGNRLVKGYNIARKILTHISKNINNIFEEYKSGNTLL